MNYSNFENQLRKSPLKAGELTMIVDRTGRTYLVARRSRPASRAVSQRIVKASAIFACAIAGIVPANAQFVMNSTPGLFTPAFRDPLNTDAGFTTFWGWGAGAFDGPTNNELIDLPPVTLGLGGLDGSLDQGTDPRDILSSGNSIYTFTFTSATSPLTLNLGVPTTGNSGMGFTTIVLQGMTMNFGADTTFPENSFIFPAIEGIQPTVVVGQNNASPFKLGQFWAKYEIPGNSAHYSIPLTLAANHISISRLEIDTRWSASGYAPDTAQAVPEPSAAIAIALGTSTLILRRRRNSAHNS